jgi:hypothetical protein
MSSGLEYEFVIARAASKFNEQWKIVGVKRSIITKKWQFTKSDPTQKQTYHLEFRVRFTRLPSQDTTMRVSKVPNLLPALPEDIFYPFSLFKSGSNSVHTKSSFTIAGLVIFICYTLITMM